MTWGHEELTELMRSRELPTINDIIGVLGPHRGAVAESIFQAMLKNGHPFAVGRSMFYRHESIATLHRWKREDFICPRFGRKSVMLLADVLGLFGVVLV